MLVYYANSILLDVSNWFTPQPPLTITIVTSRTYFNNTFTCPISTIDFRLCNHHWWKTSVTISTWSTLKTNFVLRWFLITNSDKSFLWPLLFNQGFDNKLLRPTLRSLSCNQLLLPISTYDYKLWRKLSSIINFNNHFQLWVPTSIINFNKN